MNLYLVKQVEGGGYDEFEGMVVAAESEQDAVKMHPVDGWDESDWRYVRCVRTFNGDSCWDSSPENITVQLIGMADDSVKAGVVLSSFNAG